MSYKTTQRPVQQAKQRPLTDEEKQARIIQFLQQKREAFTVNILCSLLHNNPGVHPDDVITKAVGMADKLLEKLYPINDEVHKAAEE